LIVRMERSTACRISGTVLKRMPRSGSFILGIKSRSQGLKPLAAVKDYSVPDDGRKGRSKHVEHTCSL